MSSTARVWVAEPDEADAVGRLLVDFRRWWGGGTDGPSDNAIMAGVERLVEDPATEFLLGAPHDDAPPAGVAQLRFRYGIWFAADECLLEDLFVAEHARGAGLGRALVEATIERASERGCRRVELDAREDNGPAVALYESMGFSSVDEHGSRQLFFRRHL